MNEREQFNAVLPTLTKGQDLTEWQKELMWLAWQARAQQVMWLNGITGGERIGDTLVRLAGLEKVVFEERPGGGRTDYAEEWSDLLREIGQQLNGCDGK